MAAATVQAKFRVNGIMQSMQGSRQKLDKEGEPIAGQYESYPIPTVTLTPVVAGPDASEEDKAFWSATPQGSISLVITNEHAAEFFELNKTYYVTFQLTAD